MLAITIIFTATMASASGAIDPYLMLQKKHALGADKENGGGVADNVVTALVKSRDIEAAIAAVKKAGGRARAVSSEIAVVTMPLSEIERLADTGAIDYAEADRPLDLMLDKSLPAIGATAVKNGGGDVVAYDGSGVIIGIVDTGIDWRHPAFNDAAGNSRILSIWDQGLDSADGFAPPKEIGNSYGIECLRKDVEDKTCPSKDTVGHGTHVAGIAAGRDATYGGVAPGAELVLVKASLNFSTYSTRMVDAVDYIFRKAAEAGKSAVINISMGTLFGAHDGTSLMEQALDSLVGAVPGRAIVASAGNNNRQRDDIIASIHASTELQENECRFEFLSASSRVGGILVDIWQREGASLTFGIGVDSYGAYEESGLVSDGAVYDSTLDGGQLRIIIDSTETANPENGRKHTIVYVETPEGDDSQNVSMNNYVFDLIASGSGAFDAWIWSGANFTKREGVYLSANKRYCPGDSRRTVEIPATASKVIAVASFVSRAGIGSLIRDVGTVDNYTPVNELSSFSSPGPSGDPARTGQKPEITAPGEWIISAISEDAINSLIESGAAVDVDRKFVAMRGTSMAAPHVTGAIALMLQRNPALTASQIEMLLARNATVDANFGAAPDNHWGYGKLNVENVFANFDTTDLQTPLPVNDAETDETAFVPQPDAIAPGEGNGGGCDLLGNNAVCTPIGCLMFFLFGVVALMIRRCMANRGTIVLMTAMIGLISSCGGSSTPPALNFDQTSYTQNNYLEIDSEHMIAKLYLWNSDRTSRMVLFIPLRHYFPGAQIELGSDNFFSSNSDQAALAIGQYEDDQSDIPFADWVSTAGQLTIEDADVSLSGHLSAQIINATMRPIDEEDGLIDREGSEMPFSLSVDAMVSEGSIDWPFVVDADPLSGGLGTKVRVIGFNFNTGTQAYFAGCDSYPLSTDLKSSHELEVTLSGYCKDSRLRIGSYDVDWMRTFIFDQAVDVTNQSTGVDEWELKKIVHDASTDIVIMLQSGGAVEIYSMADKTYLPSKTLPVPADTFDLAPDGAILCGKDNTLSLISADNSLLGQVAIPPGYSIIDIASGPAQSAMVLLKDDDLWKKPAVCVWDRQTMTITCPAELSLQGDFSYEARFERSYDRHAIFVTTVKSYRRGLAVYRYDDGGVVQKITEKDVGAYSRVVTHPARDEIWVGKDIYDLGLTKIGSLVYLPSIPSRSKARYYTFLDRDVGIVREGSEQKIVSFAAYDDDIDMSNDYDSSPLAAFVSNDDKYLFVIWNRRIRQVDLSLINAYLDAQ